MVLKKLVSTWLLISLLAVSFASWAGYGGSRKFEDSQGNSATLLLEACTLDFLPEEARNSALAARLVIDGKIYKACYKENDTYVVIIDEDQEILGPFPKELFKPIKEA